MVLRQGRRGAASTLGLGQGHPPELTYQRLPAPLSGLNAVDPISELDPYDAIILQNFIPDRFGVRTRPGYWRYCENTGIPRTLVSFHGDTSSERRLWVATVDGLVRADLNTGTPTTSLSWGTQSGFAGYVNYVSYNNDNGDKFILLCDQENGLHYYDPSGGTWAVAADITGVAEADLVWVVEHKERIWFVEKDTSNAWYLATGTKGGTATKFNLGNKFPHGGSLHSIYKWSVDGGDGVDDLLVFVSEAGDVAVYQGNDVSSASSWSHIGTWYIGKVPITDYRASVGVNIGGELHLLCTHGLISVQDLVQGVSIQKAAGQQSFARRITREIKDAMDGTGINDRWELLPLPSESLFMVLSESLGTGIQYVFSFARPAWAKLEGIEMECCVEHNGEVWFGISDAGNGAVCKLQGSLDNVARNGSGGDSISDCFVQTPFSIQSPDGTAVKVEFIQPIFISDGNPFYYSALAVYDYDTEKSSDHLIESGGPIQTKIRAGGEIGQVAAIQIKGTAADRTTLMAINVWHRRFSDYGLPSIDSLI